jgi:HAD superfamily hydrolase (TIGR01509 family)
MIEPLVIFDCDGVLVDSEPISNRTLAAMVTEQGLPMSTEESMRTFMGRTLSACMEILAQELGRPVPDGFLAELQRRTYEALGRDLEAVPGVEAALDALVDQNTRVCVASSGSLEKMRFTLGRTGLLGRFEGRLFSATEVEHGKPHPDVFLHAAREMGALPTDCIVVEDSVLGVEGGCAAKMRVLGFARDTCPAALAGAGARVFDDMAQLPGLIHDAFVDR